MRKTLFVVFVFAHFLHAQTSNVAATVTDPDSQTWNNGTYTINFVPTPGVPGPYTWNNGQPFTQQFKGTFSNVGVLTVSLPSSNFIAPSGSQWRFTLCPNASFQCTDVVLGVTGAAPNLSTALSSPLPPIRIAPGPSAFAYQDLEVGTPAQPLFPGAIYWNVTSGITRQWNGAAWQNLSGGGGSNIAPGTANSQIPNWSTGSLTWQPQAKAIYDVRDWATCNTPVGTTTGTDATPGIAAMLAAIGTKQATARIIGSNNPTDTCLVNTISWPANVTLDFSGGGAFTLINTVTPPGGGALDGSVASTFQSSASTCSLTLNVPTSGDAVVLLTNYRFATGGGLGLPSDTKGDVYRLVSQSDADSNHYSSNTFGWVASNVPSGSITITIPWVAAPPASTCAAFAVSGLGPSVGADGTGVSCTTNCNTNSPMTTFNSATYTSGSFIVAFGGNNSTSETCTAGASFTQILDIGTSMNLCVQIIASTAGGAITATSAINNTPTGNIWMYNSFGLKPIAATEFVQGGIINPNLHQIFYQATGASTVDFTGNLVFPTVYPEWWGALPAGTAANNTPAMQAAEHGAFGTGRSNASGLGIYNKQLYLSGIYSINAELQFYHVIGSQAARWDISCAAGGGIKQTSGNLRLMDAQAIAYGTIHRCTFQQSASSTKPILDWDYDGHTAAPDLAVQFITCYDCSFIGNSVTDVGVLIAKSGGAAQGSNVYCINCEFQAFTGAGWQIGGDNIGRNVGRFGAENALDIGLYGGDMQNCPLYGVANYGGGYVEVHNMTFECTSPWGSYYSSIGTAVDVYSDFSQGPIIVEHVRSEDLQLVWGNNIFVTDSANTNQAFYFYSPVECHAGLTLPLSSLFSGSDLGSDGALYRITVHGTAFGGLCLTNASSGTGTTISDTNQRVAGAQVTGTFVLRETVTQAVTGSTGTLLNLPVSVGTITGSVTSGTIGVSDTVTQATTGVHCTSGSPAPTGSGNLLVTACSGTADSTHVWTDGTTGGTYTPSSAPVFSPASPVMLITAATGAPDSTHNWTGGTSGAVLVPSAAPVNDVNFTVNQFATSAPAQQQITIWQGTGAGMICGPITANTATSITCASGWTTTYYGVHLANPDSTSQFIIEPYWAGAPTQSGDVQFSRLDATIIGGGNSLSGNQSGDCIINHVFASGGILKCSSGGQLDQIHDLIVSRPDWAGSVSFVGGASISLQRIDNVKIVRPYSGVIPAGPGVGFTWPNYSINNPRSGGATAYTGPSQSNFGTIPIVWSGGGNGTIGGSASDIVVGGRSDPASGTDVFRNRFEVNSTIGPPAPVAFNMTNLNGAAGHFGGGPASGSGTPGSACLSTGTPGAGGTTITTGADRWCVDGATGNLLDQGTHNFTVGGVATLGSGSTKLIQTNTASNTDLTGEISFAGVTTGSYSFTGTYTSHPECMATPQFDIGASNRIWVTYTSTTSFTVNFNSAETGSVSYICIGRN